MDETRVAWLQRFFWWVNKLRLAHPRDFLLRQKILLFLMGFNLIFFGTNINWNFFIFLIEKDLFSWVTTFQETFFVILLLYNNQTVIIYVVATRRLWDFYMIIIIEMMVKNWTDLRFVKAVFTVIIYQVIFSCFRSLSLLLL